MMPAIILEARPQEKILDMCAAPGSKTTYLASFMENRGTIDAWDIYPHKINLIRENAKRLGISIIHAEVKDSTRSYPTLYNTYDKVLLDAPCSGLGVINHKPEIKWRQSEADLMEFPKIQKKLLENASRYIKKDGILVYSTCTLNKKENEISNESLKKIAKKEMEKELEEALKNGKFKEIFKDMQIKIKISFKED